MYGWGIDACTMLMPVVGFIINNTIEKITPE